MASKRKMWLDGPYPYIHGEVVTLLDLFASDAASNIFYEALDKCIEEITRLIDEENRVPTKFTVLLRADTLPMEKDE